MNNVEVKVEITVNHAYPHRDWEAKVTREVKVEADISALLSIPFEELCRSLAHKALIEFRANELKKQEEKDGSD